MQRTGSEIVLFNLLKNISPRYKISLVTEYKGELSGLLPTSIKKDFLYHKPSVNRLSKIINNIRRKRILSKYKNSVWYINTIVLPDIIEYAEKRGIKTILHLHELEHMFIALTKEQLNRTIWYPFLIIANSKASRDCLNSFGRKENIEICYPGIETKKIIKNKQVYLKYRNELKISKSTFLWVMCGTLDRNKNPFLFIEIAFEIIKNNPDTLFMWIGNVPNDSFKYQCLQKARNIGISKKIIWMTCDSENYYNYFQCADGFVLTSEKESFSLVTIEALLLELPVVAQNCLGVNEILENDFGQIIQEKNNAKKMAEKMIGYMDGTYMSNSEKGMQKAFQFDIKIWAEKWNEILKNNIK